MAGRNNNSAAANNAAQNAAQNAAGTNQGNATQGNQGNVVTNQYVTLEANRAKAQGLQTAGLPEARQIAVRNPQAAVYNVGDEILVGDRVLMENVFDSGFKDANGAAVLYIILPCMVNGVEKSKNVYFSAFTRTVPYYRAGVAGAPAEPTGDVFEPALWEDAQGNRPGEQFFMDMMGCVSVADQIDLLQHGGHRGIRVVHVEAVTTSRYRDNTLLSNTRNARVPVLAWID